jgi:hypothetical protein
MNKNGRPRKSKTPRMRAIEASLEALYEIADAHTQKDDETVEESEKRVISYLENSELPLGEDTADFFLPSGEEMVMLLEAIASGPQDLMVTVAAIKAQNFMHGYLHAQIEDGKRAKDGSIL